MTERGVIAVDRGVLTHPRFAPEPFTEREAWIWLIKEAAFKEHARRVNGLTIKLRRGQLAHSLRYMAEQWQWSVKRVRRFLAMLQKDFGPEDEALIEASIDTGVTVLTIRKYNSYQRWLRLAETPHVELPGTGLGTPTTTATTTGQTELNLYPTSKISDEIVKRGTPTTTATDTPTTTARAQEGHKEESIAYQEEEEEGGALRFSGRDLDKVTTEDLVFAERFLRTINWPMPEDARIGVAPMVLVWRRRGYDPGWILAIAAEIAITKPKRDYTLNYVYRAIAVRHDERAREIALSVCPTITPATVTSNGKPTECASNGWKKSRDRWRAALDQYDPDTAGVKPSLS